MPATPGIIALRLRPVPARRPGTRRLAWLGWLVWLVFLGYPVSDLASRHFGPAVTVAAGPSPLTARERDVLVASAEGSSVADVAARLYLFEGTVRNYISMVIGKTGTGNRMEAVRATTDRGWM